MASRWEDRLPFIRAIIDNPFDDLPRLVYADFLEEQANGDIHEELRAAFIRTQIDPSRPKLSYNLGWYCDKRHIFGHERLSKWFSRAAGSWVHPKGPFFGRYEWNDITDKNPDVYTAIEKTRLVWRRGFVDEIQIRLSALLGGPCWFCRPVGDRHESLPSLGLGEVCPVCKDKGVIEGCIQDVFKSEPVTKIRLIDTRVARVSYRKMVSIGLCAIPGFDSYNSIIEGEGGIYPFILGEDQERFNGLMDQLSNLLVSHGRSVAGLPAMKEFDPPSSDRGEHPIHRLRFNVDGGDVDSGIVFTDRNINA